MNLLRLARTIRQLTAAQALAQVRRRLQRGGDPSHLVREVAFDGQVPSIGWRPRAPWLGPDASSPSSAEVLAGRLTFVGVERHCGWPPAWDDPNAPELWRYNLHYHAFLFGLDHRSARTAVASYFEQHRPNRDATGWEPYPLSLRLTSWLALFFGRWREETMADEGFARRLWLEVRRMARWLGRRLETHLLANHLLENAIGLSLAGACFEGAEPEGWKRQGLELLRAELDEQLLADGGHFERSPMYQQRLLYGLALLLNSGDPELFELCAEPAARMAAWLVAMTHPDGEIALFNDAAFGVYPKTADLVGWLQDIGLAVPECGVPGPPFGYLAPSGYFTARNDQGDAFFMDAGEIGPSYQPGHAHADFLSIELSLAGKRLVVDGGTYEYERGPKRDWARSVRAHSTILVGDEEPLELWGAFRVGRRGVPIEVTHGRKPDGAHRFSAAHTGYRHLLGKPMPTREALWLPRGIVRLRDTVSATRGFVCASQLRINGEWGIDRVSKDRLRCLHGDLEGAIMAGGPISIEPSRWFPHFGVEAPAYLLRQPLNADSRPIVWVICRSEHVARAESLLSPLSIRDPEKGGR